MCYLLLSSHSLAAYLWWVANFIAYIVWSILWETSATSEDVKKCTKSINLLFCIFVIYVYIPILVACGLSTYDELQTLLPTLFDQSCEKFMQCLRMERRQPFGVWGWNMFLSIPTPKGSKGLPQRFDQSWEYFVCPRFQMLVCISGVVLMMSQVIAYIVWQICDNNRSNWGLCVIIWSCLFWLFCFSPACL